MVTNFKAVAVAGIAAVRDFNERAVTYVPALADLEGCDKQLSINLLDSGSTGLSALEQLARPLFNPVNGTDVHAVIGPSRSAASLCRRQAPCRAPQARSCTRPEALRKLWLPRALYSEYCCNAIF